MTFPSSRYAALCESLGLPDESTWAARALASCLTVLGRCSTVNVIDAALRSDTRFAVVYRRDEPEIAGLLLGTVGDREAAATLRLMPHIDEADVPLDPEQYGLDFALVGVEEPFGIDDYDEPDANGVRWFNPPDFRSVR